MVILVTVAFLSSQKSQAILHGLDGFYQDQLALVQYLILPNAYLNHKQTLILNLLDAKTIWVDIDETEWYAPPLLRKKNASLSSLESVKLEKPADIYNNEMNKLLSMLVMLQKSVQSKLMTHKNQGIFPIT